MTHYYIFPIGDHSGDGHAFVAEFLIKGDKPLQEVRETHFAHDWIGELCREDEDDVISLDIFQQTPQPQKTSDFMQGLVTKHNLEVNADAKRFLEIAQKYNLDFSDSSKEDVDEISMTPESLIELWVFLLNEFNSLLNLKVVSPAMSRHYVQYKGYPVDKELIDGHINFGGRDAQGRHLQTPGYGVWSDNSDMEFYLDCN